MEQSQKTAYSEDDEEDLEALRLAALQSLKPRNAISTSATSNGTIISPCQNTISSEKHMRFNRSKPPKRGRYFGISHQGRSGKNGQFNNRVRNTNLISITPVETDQREKDSHNSKLTLPQDRYNGINNEKLQEAPINKFNRYNNSDKSDSESEDVENIYEGASGGEESGSPLKLERSNSLEALMKELDEEILGTSNENSEKVVKVKKAKKSTESEKKSTVIKPKEELEVKNVPSEPPPPPSENKPTIKQTRVRSPLPPRRHTPPKRKKRNYHNVANFNLPSGFERAPFAPVAQFNPPFNHLYAAPLIPPVPNTFRPFDTPLTIATDNLTTSLAPLSPRSAAFVLQNRAIIEKRKRSPRSYSRSPSPRRRSRSPHVTPRRSLSPRRKSRSPRRRSSLSPRRSSPVSRKSPKPNRPPIRERLGVKNSPVENAKNDTPVDKISDVENNNKKEINVPVDPILEARKRKFESNEIKIKEGVIRLKPKDEPEKESKTEENKELDDEDVLLGVADDEIELETKVEDFFSDEDSDNENEGRFKAKAATSKGSVTGVLPFTKLQNDIKSTVKEEALPDDSRRPSYRDARRRPRNERREKLSTIPISLNKRSVKPKSTKNTASSLSKRKITLKSERISPPRRERKFDRKIEIKIKNPSKYEPDEVDSKDEKKNASRKVEVTAKNDPSKEVVPENIESEPEIIEEDGSCDEKDIEDTNISEGDLRTQLSKKRAERLTKYTSPMDAAVPSRLLQNALQGAVFKKEKKKSVTDSENNDGKIPIHLRLGIANSSDIFTETKVRKKSRKHKNRLEQV